MWVCEKCGLEFEELDQPHFCGGAPTVDGYIASQREELHPLLNNVRGALREALPDAEERISWRMPTFWRKKNLIHFAAMKNHLGIYPGEKAVIHFEKETSDYKTSKGAIQFPYNKEIPIDLICEIARWCYETENQ